MMKVTKKTNLNELVTKYPDVAELLLDYGLHCVGCFANQFDSIEDGCKIHGYDDATIKDIVWAINEFITSKKSKNQSSKLKAKNKK